MRTQASFGTSLLLGILGVALACGDDTSDPPVTPTPSVDAGFNNNPGCPGTGIPPTNLADNNYARLTGDAVGPDSTPVASLRKTVPITVTTPNPDLSVAAMATVFRRSDSTESMRWHIAVTNQSTQVGCFAKLEGLVFKDAGGNTILDDGDTFIEGAIGETNAGDWTGTCLGPGQTGFELGIDTSGLYSMVASVEVTTSSFSQNSEPLPAARVLPIRYVVAAADEFTVTVQNTGTAPAFVDGSSRYVLLDASNEPLYWGFLQGTAEIGPCESFGLVEDSLSYEGTAAAMDVIVAFDNEP